jgi:AAA+ superfamily predicted ATPase
MEELQTKTMYISVSGKTISCQVKERDFGDLIVFDVYSEDQYLFTLSQKGDVLFNEYELGHQKTIMDPRQLNEIIEMIKEKIETDPN